MENQSAVPLMKRTIEAKEDNSPQHSAAVVKQNQVGNVLLYGIPIVSLYIEAQERLCLAQISNTLLKQFSYNEIHNRRVALGITCVQCTPVQLEILRRAGAMPVSSRRCGMITRREAERLCKSFLGDNAPPRLPDDFAFSVHHECAWGCRGSFLPSRYNSSRAKCIKCAYCGLFFSPNKFIFHSHRIGHNDKYIQPDAANFNSWRRHMKLSGGPPEEITHAWEDVKAMFNGGTRKRLLHSASSSSGGHGRGSNDDRGHQHRSQIPSPKRAKGSNVSPPLMQVAAAAVAAKQFPIRPVNIHPTTQSNSNMAASLAPDLPLSFPRSFMMDYMWQHAQQQTKQTTAFQFPTYAMPWLKRPSSILFSNTQPNTNSIAAVDTKTMQLYNNSAFKPVRAICPPTPAPSAVPTTTTTTSSDDEQLGHPDEFISPTPPHHDHDRGDSHIGIGSGGDAVSSDEEMVDIESTEEVDCILAKYHSQHHHQHQQHHHQQHQTATVATSTVNVKTNAVHNSLMNGNGHHIASAKGGGGEQCQELVTNDLNFNEYALKKETHDILTHKSRAPTPSEVSRDEAIPALDQSSSSTSVITISPHKNGTASNSGEYNLMSTATTPPTTSTTAATTTSTSSSSTSASAVAAQQAAAAAAAAEFWSVARLSLDRAEMNRVPFYRQEISKHFDVFRNDENNIV